MAGRPPRLPNDLAAGSYFGGRKPEDGRIDWSRPAAEVYNLIRAVAPPYPGAFTDLGGQRLIVARARRPLPDVPMTLTGLAPGLHLVGGLPVGLCGDGGAVCIHDIRIGTAGGPSLTAAALGALLPHHA
jgi:methionyl-tRNA formyltransferase